MILNIFISSADRYASDVTQSGRSFTNITNNRGPRPDHFGIPDVTGLHVDSYLTPPLAEFYCLVNYLSKILLLLIFFMLIACE